MGNYGESFDCMVGFGLLLKIDCGVNVFWNVGGFMYVLFIC